jgi:hypothetical protein
VQRWLFVVLPLLLLLLLLSLHYVSAGSVQPLLLSTLPRS